MADRHGRLPSIRLGFILAAPSIAGIVLSTSLPVVLVFVALAGVGCFMPLRVFVVLGQNYLPNRIGTASGVSIGLAVSIGGLFNPLLALLLSAMMLEPGDARKNSAPSAQQDAQSPSSL